MCKKYTGESLGNIRLEKKYHPISRSIANIDGGIFVDGDTSDSSKPHAYLQLEDFPDVIYNVDKAKHGFAVTFKIKFDQRDRDYKEPRYICLLYTSPSPRDATLSRMPSSA